jgi:hypothetical protein
VEFVPTNSAKAAPSRSEASTPSARGIPRRRGRHPAP